MKKICILFMVLWIITLFLIYNYKKKDVIVEYSYKYITKDKYDKFIKNFYNIKLDAKLSIVKERLYGILKPTIEGEKYKKGYKEAIKVGYEMVYNIDDLEYSLFFNKDNLLRIKTIIKSTGEPVWYIGKELNNKIKEEGEFPFKIEIRDR